MAQSLRDGDDVAQIGPGPTPSGIHAMTSFLWIGAVFAAIGIAGLVWCIRRASRLRRSDAGRDETQRVLQTLVAVNFASVALAFLGLAMMIAGGLL